MVNVKITKYKDGTQISLIGHAGCRAVTGGDIVCSAVSMVTTMMAQMLEDNSHLFTDYAISLNSGDACISYIPKGRTGETLANSMIRGYELLEGSYASYIKIFTNRETRSLCDVLMTIDTGERSERKEHDNA